jgi:phage-related protein
MFRVVFVLQIGDNIWIVHAFQKKSKQDIDLIHERLRRLKEMLR